MKQESKRHAATSGASYVVDTPVSSTALRNPVASSVRFQLVITSITAGDYAYSDLEVSADNSNWTKISRLKRATTGTSTSIAIAIAGWLYIRTTTTVIGATQTGTGFSTFIILSEAPVIESEPDIFPSILDEEPASDVTANGTTYGNATVKWRSGRANVLLRVFNRVDGTYTSILQGSHDGSNFVTLATAAVAASANGWTALAANPIDANPWPYLRAGVTAAAVTTGADVELFILQQP